MAVEVHVEGRVASGRLPDFAEAVERYRAYAAENGYAVPRVLLGLSGPMNTVRLVYRYEELSAYDEHEFRAMTDREYGELAGAMGFVDGSLRYTVYRRIQPSPPTWPGSTSPTGRRRAREDEGDPEATGDELR